MNTLKVRFLSVFMLASLLAAAFPTSNARAAGTIIRVSPRPLSKVCGSWSRPCGLQQALKMAVAGDQIWILAGTYKPTSGTDRTISFTIKDGVMVYGGFAGNETNINQRDLRTYVTILSGDIGVSGEIMDNSYHVVVTSGTSNATVLDGVTITGGNADGDVASNYDKGAGLLNLNGNLTLRNLSVRENYSDGHGSNLTGAGAGAGMYSTGDPTLEKVIFSENETGDPGTGGGMYSFGNPLIKDVTFQDNWAAAGGGLESMGAPTLTNVTFIRNGAYNAGGMGNTSITYGTAVLTNVTFDDNIVCHNGAGLYSIGDVTLTNVTFRGNHALNHRGGGVFMNHGILSARNIILWGNTALVEGSQVYVGSSAIADIRYSVIEGGCPAGSSCSDITTADPMLGTLGDYGGSTQTIPLYSGSSAIDAGDDATCSATDQRGVVRPQGSHCDIGAYEVESAVVGPGTYDDTHPSWIYSGTWLSYSEAGPYNGTYHYSSDLTASASFTFVGSGFNFKYVRHSARGLIEVWVDGVKVDTINAYNSVLVWQAVYSKTGLGPGTHTVVFKHGGPSNNVYIDIDAIQIVPSAVGPVTYDDTDPAWSYTGNWTAYTDNGPYNGTLHYTDVAGNSAELLFNGTSFTLLFTKYTNRGSVDIYVDNLYVTTINAYGSTLQWQQSYTSPVYPLGNHTVRFVHAGGGAIIDVDAITILP